tara:strand:- start:2283 stop:3080 length:798 start_codon:yes stop_codon:yes gene_type:complete
MSWRYKLYDIEPDHVVSIEPINENFQPFVEELAGGLNEHNFKADAFTLANFADDAALRLHQVYGTAIPGNPLVGYTNPTAAGWAAIQATDGWQAFSDEGLRLEFVGRGGTTYLCASFNIHCGTNATSVAGFGTPKYRQMGFGYLVALRVNGSVLHETILGSGDPSQDDFRSTSFSLQAARPFANKSDFDPLAERPQGGGGLAGARLPIVVDAVVDLLPGSNLIEVVVMNIRGSMQRVQPRGPLESYDSSLTYIGHRELFALEMVR